MLNDVNVLTGLNLRHRLCDKVVILDIMTATYTVSFETNCFNFALFCFTPENHLLKLVELFSGHLGYKKPKVSFSIVVARIL